MTNLSDYHFFLVGHKVVGKGEVTRLLLVDVGQALGGNGKSIVFGAFSVNQNH